MFLYLDKSLLESFVKPVPHDIVEAIQGLAAMLRSGVHLVSGDRETLIAISKLEEVSSSARAIFRKAVARHAQANSVFNYMVAYALVDFGRAGLESSQIAGKRVIKIPIAKVSNLIAQVATEIVYEDVNDAVIYDVVARWYAESILNNTHLPIKCKPVQGGGNRIFVTYAARQSDENTFCLCITDSDRKFPLDQPGDTSEKVREVDDELKPLSCHLDLDFHEVENLIPLAFLESLAGTDEAKNILSALRMAEQNNHKEAKLYWDYKKGVRAHYARTDEGYRDYWGGALGHGVIDCDTACPPNQCECFLVRPWPLKQQVKAAIKDKVRMDPSDCSVLEELWIDIGKNLVSWTIGTAPHLT